MTKAYVFAANTSTPQMLAGVLESDGYTGSFKYSDSWLSQPNSYPLDPVNLPLANKTFFVSNNKGVQGVFSDAGPDDWGTRILLLQHQHLPANELERLLRTSGKGVGCLTYSLSRSRPKTVSPLPQLKRIQELVSIIERAETNSSLTPEELQLIDPGSSMGGARPKVSCCDENEKKWLLKFSRKNDLLNIPKLEFASLQLLKNHLALNVPESRLLNIGESIDAFMIERFDHNCHFISAHSLFNQEKIRLVQDSKLNPYSYINLASILRKHADNFEADCVELFKRMVANILLGNTDDHARNHALMYDFEKQYWSLSPLYDVLPTIGSNIGRQALGVGKQGATSSIENALSYCQLFGLSTQEATSVTKEIEKLIRQHWPKQLQEVGFNQQEIDLVLKYSQVS